MNSESLDDRFFKALQEAFLGEHLCVVEANAKALKFVFTGGIALNLDISNAWDQDVDEEVCSLNRGGLSVILSANRQVRLRPDRDYRQAA